MNILKQKETEKKINEIIINARLKMAETYGRLKQIESELNYWGYY